jgi:glyoxylase-like metal-dependent hydrolase (beta-lactamase superfamily II)
VYPDELEAVPAVLEQSRFPISGLLATHGDWDHLLGRLAFPHASLGCAESTAMRLRASPGVAQRELRRFDEEHYVERRGPLALGGVRELPVPGRLTLGGKELNLHPAAGHTSDGMAIWIPWAGVLVCGDYISPLEIPMISEGGSVEAYLATLERLRPLVDQADRLVPGHGTPCTPDEAKRLLQEDVDYLQALRAGHDRKLPEGRGTSAQRQIHEHNLERLGG